TYYGGNANDIGASIVTDISGNIFVTGRTESSNFPVQNSGGGSYFQGSTSGGEDLFISKFESSIVGFEPVGINIPDKFLLYQNYPNPFNPLTNIRFDIPERSVVRLQIYDLKGKVQMKLPEQILEAGSYKFTLDGGKLSSGIYFYRLEAGDFRDTKKMVLVK
ncbi:MAG: T9SS type A sorting domain-containing protein, partial [Ignavibacteria bacterium]|nr:T9SS type A sorting domain-containing protein [Ignavibacteria bacterium]